MSDSSKRIQRSKTSGSDPAKAPIEFPSTRYFQTHFEFIEEHLKALQEEVSRLHQRLDILENQDKPEACQKEIRCHSKPYLNN